MTVVGQLCRASVGPGRRVLGRGALGLRGSGAGEANPAGGKVQRELNPASEARGGTIHPPQLSLRLCILRGGSQRALLVREPGNCRIPRRSSALRARDGVGARISPGTKFALFKPSRNPFFCNFLPKWSFPQGSEPARHEVASIPKPDKWVSVVPRWNKYSQASQPGLTLASVAACLPANVHVARSMGVLCQTHEPFASRVLLPPESPWFIPAVHRQGTVWVRRWHPREALPCPGSHCSPRLLPHTLSSFSTAEPAVPCSLVQTDHPHAPVRAAAPTCSSNPHHSGTFRI